MVKEEGTDDKEEPPQINGEGIKAGVDKEEIKAESPSESKQKLKEDDKHKTGKDRDKDKDGNKHKDYDRKDRDRNRDIAKERDVDRERERGRERDRDRARGRDRDRDRDRDIERDRTRDRDKDRDRNRDRDRDRDKDRDRRREYRSSTTSRRDRDYRSFVRDIRRRSRDRSRDRSRSQGTRRSSKDRSKSRGRSSSDRSKSRGRSSSRSKSGDRSKSRDRNDKSKSPEHNKENGTAASPKKEPEKETPSNGDQVETKEGTTEGEEKKGRKRKSMWDTPPEKPTGSVLPLPQAATPQAVAAQAVLLEQLKALEMARAISMQHQQHQALAIQQAQIAAHNARAMAIQCRIYVGSVHFDLTEQDITTAFSAFGPIKSVNMSKDPVTGKSKGFCFIEYANPDHASAAVNQMNGFLIGGRPIKVGRPNIQLLPMTPTGATPGAATLPTALNTFSPALSPFHPFFALNGFKMPTIPAIPNPAIFKNPVIPTPGTITTATNSTTTTTTVPTIPNIPTVTVPTAVPTAPANIANHALMSAIAAANPTGGVIPNPAAVPNCRIYIGSIHWDLSEDDIKQVFSTFGTIRKISLMVNQETGKHKGYGFIEYDNPKSAEDAINLANGLELCNRPIKVGKAAMGIIPVTPPAPATITTPAAPVAIPGVAVPNTITLGGVTVALPPGVIITPQQLQQLQQLPMFTQQLAPGMTGMVGAPAVNAFSQPKLEDSLSQEENMTISANQRYAIMQKLARGDIKTPSRVVLLQNMVGSDEVDTDLETEVTDECSKFGVVDKVVIYQERQSEHDVVVKIFVLFSTTTGAQTAVGKLNGRWFGGRVIKASFYDDGLFGRQIYSG